MLKTISPLISPELLKVLAEMGHGDEIIFSDAHFPAHSMGPQVIRADGLLVSDLLQAIIPLFELDSYAPPLVHYKPRVLTSSASIVLRFMNGRKKPLRSLSQANERSTGIFF